MGMVSTWMGEGTTVAHWLRCYVTNRKVAGSIPASVSEFFIGIKFFRSHYDPGVDSASNRNEYQEYFLGVSTRMSEGGAATAQEELQKMRSTYLLA